MNGKPPELRGVLETVLYYTDEERTARFYGEVLGLRLVGREPGRSLFYRAGDGVFLLFELERARQSGTLPPHGATGPIHTCFRAAPGTYVRWKAHLPRHGVAILQEATWEKGRSFYFHDPHGNLLEIADNDIWPE